MGPAAPPPPRCPCSGSGGYVPHRVAAASDGAAHAARGPPRQRGGHTATPNTGRPTTPTWHQHWFHREVTPPPSQPLPPQSAAGLRHNSRATVPAPRCLLTDSELLHLVRAALQAPFASARRPQAGKQDTLLHKGWTPAGHSLVHLAVILLPAVPACRLRGAWPPPRWMHPRAEPAKVPPRGISGYSSPSLATAREASSTSTSSAHSFSSRDAGNFLSHDTSL